MQWSWPAIVNYYEAKAYCRWLNEQEDREVHFRLLQESEHLAIRDRRLALEEVSASRGDVVNSLKKTLTPNEQSLANHNLKFGSESPVDAMAPNDRGFHDTFGNVWQWCEDTFHSLPGFNIHPYYTDFSTPCFDGKHQMMLGLSLLHIS